MRKAVGYVLTVIRAVFSLIGGYVGVISTILGTIFGMLAALLLAGVVAGVCVYVKVLPMVTEAREVVFDNLVNMREKDFRMTESTVIYDDKGSKLGVVNAGSFKYTKLSKISPYIYNGYIAVEDKRFKTHAGVDMLATMRAGVALLKNHMQITQGGSTITQQVVKNNLLTQQQTYTRKIAEILLAPAVEEKFGKDKIMEFYCNSNYYGNRCYGVAAASKYYFGKKPAKLRPEEAAMLIALSNSPSAYDPVTDPKAARQKRNEVLQKMYEEDVISRSTYKKSKKKKLRILQKTEKDFGKGYLVSYAVHCAALSLMKQDGFKFQYTFKDKKDYKDYHARYSATYGKKCDEIRSGGYKIYTSLDREKQEMLQDAVDSGLAYSTERSADDSKYALQGAAVCVDNSTDYVVAIVGGRGQKDPFNRAYLSARQSGSAIKPLIDYAPAFESGLFTPSTIVNDHEMEDGPKNSGEVYRGEVTIREAVERSLNTVAWQVLDAITPEYGLSFLDKMQFHNLSYVDNGNLALSLGGFTEGVRVVDMAKGYATLADNGRYSDRTCIRKIKYQSKGVIYKDEEQIKQVYSEGAAWMMTDVLRGVLEKKYGTAHALKLDGGQIAAGKTGTTNSSKDVWFCGYTSYYTTVVWCGYDTPRAMPGTYGATLSGQIWKDYMNTLHAEMSPRDFARPGTVYTSKYDKEGNRVEGTESYDEEERKGKRDYFMSSVGADDEEPEEAGAAQGSDQESTGTDADKNTAAALLADKPYQKKVLKKLRKFEKMTIKSIAGYYNFMKTYRSLKDKIASIVDDDVRAEYSTRCTDKYESLKDDTLAWKDVVKAYEKQQSEENRRLAEESADASLEARNEQIRQNRISLAQTRLKQLQGYTYQPDDVDRLVKKAKKAVKACRQYPEHEQLYEEYVRCRREILALPLEGEGQTDQVEELID